MIDTYKSRFEEALARYVDTMQSSDLSKACTYALTNGGKRLRPILVLMVAEAIGCCDVMPSALGVEFFHTASLIADDLPCMDNDDKRRGRASLHKAFNETTAVLASYKLIAIGYGSIEQNAKKMRENPLFAGSADKRALMCLEIATHLAGEATEGQFMDLFPPDESLETIQDVIYKKTVTLFEISFYFGWLFGGGDLVLIDKVKKCAYHLGMAFQIADDLEDGAQDLSHKGGTNIAASIGKIQAIRSFESQMELLEKSLKELHLWTQPFRQVFELLALRGSSFSRSFLIGS